MSPRFVRRTEEVAGPPRASGDEPAPEFLAERLLESAPRERG